MDLRQWATFKLLAYIVATAASLSYIALFTEVEGASFTFQNNCKYTVWPGILPNGGRSLLADGGFELGIGQTKTLDAPVGWSGRFWGRRGCSFAASTTSSAVACQSGDCGGKLQCSGTGAATPATLAEITLAGTQPSVKQDFYDVSLVDGYNIPIAIVPSTINSNTNSETASSEQQHEGAPSSSESYLCQVAGCITDLNLNCPSELQVVAAATASAMADGEAVVGCKSACEAFQSPQYCCTGSYANPNTCQPSSYSKLFKQACPRAYSYAYDDPTSTYTCAGSNYSIVFCPSSLRYLQLDGHMYFIMCMPCMCKQRERETERERERERVNVFLFVLLSQKIGVGNNVDSSRAKKTLLGLAVLNIIASFFFL